jgi:hypothetical protein
MSVGLEARRERVVNPFRMSVNFHFPNFRRFILQIYVYDFRQFVEGFTQLG